MRKITEQAATAFYKGQPFKSGNTRVEVSDKRTCLLLHGNLIATKPRGEDAIYLSCCGWNTPTTRERLNGILDIYCLPFRYAQRKHLCCLIKIPGQTIIREDIECMILGFDLTNQTIIKRRFDHV